MSTVEIKSRVSFNELLSGVEQLSPTDLEKFISKVLALRRKMLTVNTEIPQIEIQLIDQINKQLSPVVQKRYDALMEKSWKETLTDKEHNELQQIIEKIETQNAERAEAIFTLSQIRGVNAETLMLEIEQSGRKNTQ